MWLIVGLGNPGLRYRYTRHNIGFRVIDRLSQEFSIPVTKKGMMAKWGKGHWEDRKVVLAKPQTFMNVSGDAVRRLVTFFRIETPNLIIIHDDLDLHWGKMRVREKGGDGGHKGVRSIIDGLGKGDFIRVRMGIGRPDTEEDAKEYVLGGFDRQEKRALEALIDSGKEAVTTILAEGTSVAMNRFNRRKSLECHN